MGQILSSDFHETTFIGQILSYLVHGTSFQKHFMDGSLGQFIGTDTFIVIPWVFPLQSN